MRKPREFRKQFPKDSCNDVPALRAACHSDSCGRFASFAGRGELSKPRELRELSAWLLKAADWLEGEE